MEVFFIPSKGQLKGVFVTCDVCGKEVYKTQSQYRAHIHHFCSQECSNKYSHMVGTIDKNCEFCGKTFNKRISDPKRFCSVSCQHEWQKTNVGQNNSRYRRVIHSCDYCGKEHIVKLYKTKNKNLFCSTECKRKWFSEVWSQRDEWKNESSIRAARILSDGLISTTNTKPQIAVDKMLESINEKYVKEYNIKNYSIDDYLPDSDLYIEVMGDFWHTSPKRYNFPKYDKQIAAIKRDILKRKYIENNYGKHILYLWESDINENKDLCVLLIKKFISSGGVLPNYHSFNYSIYEDDAALNENIIIAYQDLDNMIFTTQPNA